MAQAVIEGNSHFYVTLEGDDAIYDFVLPGAIQIVSYKVGDDISFTFVENTPTCTVSEITSGLRDDAPEQAKPSDASAAASSASSASAASASAASTEATSESSASAKPENGV